MRTLCRIAEVSESGYYQWLTVRNKPVADMAAVEEIKAICAQGRGRYGWRRVKMRLSRTINHKKIQRIMRENNLRARVRRSNPYRVLMRKTAEHQTAKNVLARSFKQEVPFRVFCTDITYLRFQRRFIYLSVIKDIATGEIVGWNPSLCSDLLLVADTVKDMRNRVPESMYRGGLIHSDQGFQYTHPSYRRSLVEMRLVQSMSRKGACIDNAPVESFFGHMKDELTLRGCQTFEEARAVIDEYMRYYNNERKQWGRKKMTPVEYRGHLEASAKGSH